MGGRRGDTPVLANSALHFLCQSTRRSQVTRYQGRTRCRLETASHFLRGLPARSPDGNVWVPGWPHLQAEGGLPSGGANKGRGDCLANAVRPL